MKISGNMYENKRVTLNGRIKCPIANLEISAVHCCEFCCEYFSAKHIKRGGLLEVWCSYEK